MGVMGGIYKGNGYVWEWAEISKEKKGIDDVSRIVNNLLCGMCVSFFIVEWVCGVGTI